MKFGKAFINIVLIAVVLIAVYLVFRLLTDGTGGLSTTGNGAQQPTPNLTAVAEWTPTPNAPNQAENLVATAFPTPVTRMMPADREAFRLAFLEKLTAESINWNLLSSINHAGVSWRCKDLSLFGLSLKDSDSGSLVAVWAEWFGGVDNKTMKVVIEDGSEAAPVSNPLENTIDIYKNAKVTIIFPDFGILGPVIQQGNQVAIAIDKPNLLYNVWLSSREWITGEDLITQKQSDNVNAALKWANIDSIAPLMPDGSRDPRYLNLLFDMAAGSFNPNIASVAMPNGDTVVLDHSIYNTLMSIARDAAKTAGYADVESLTVIITKPQDINGYHRLDNQGIPVVPTDIATQMADSSCPQLKLEQDALNGLANAGLSDKSLSDIVSRLLETVWAK